MYICQCLYCVAMLYACLCRVNVACALRERRVRVQRVFRACSARVGYMETLPPVFGGSVIETNVPEKGRNGNIKQTARK